jgi:DNA-binding response OmpR family regulator
LGVEFRSLKSQNFIFVSHIQTPPWYREGRIIMSVVQKKAQGRRRLLSSVGDPLPMDFPSRKIRVDSRNDEGVVFLNYFRILLKNGIKVDLTARALDVLWVLVKARGEVVTKDELIEQVWAGSLKSTIFRLRSRRSEGRSSKTVV